MADAAGWSAHRPLGALAIPGAVRGRGTDGIRIRLLSPCPHQCDALLGSAPDDHRVHVLLCRHHCRADQPERRSMVIPAPRGSGHGKRRILATGGASGSG
jgi:hypothetical protein